MREDTSTRDALGPSMSTRGGAVVGASDGTTRLPFGVADSQLQCVASSSFALARQRSGEALSACLCAADGGRPQAQQRGRRRRRGGWPSALRPCSPLPTLRNPAPKRPTSAPQQSGLVRASASSISSAAFSACAAPRSCSRRLRRRRPRRRPSELVESAWEEERDGFGILRENK